MKHANDETGLEECCVAGSDFQREVLEKLGRLEAKVDMIVGNGQPGRMTLAENRLAALERDNLRRNVYDRIVIAGITFTATFVMSAIIAWRSFLWVK